MTLMGMAFEHNISMLYTKNLRIMPACLLALIVAVALRNTSSSNLSNVSAIRSIDGFATT